LKSQKVTKLHQCKVCNVKIAGTGICKKCAKAMSAVTMVLGKLGISEDHPLWTPYFSAVFAKMSGRRNVFISRYKEKVSFLVMATLEAAESKDGHRTKADYIMHMEQGDMIRAYYYEDHGEMPTDEHVSEVIARAKSIGTDGVPDDSVTS
jgi:hypothetical protein